MSEKMELLPDPVRMVEGLRDTGYQFNTAVADVVDNSISAKATIVDIDLRMDLRVEYAGSRPPPSRNGCTWRRCQPNSQEIY